MANLKINYFPVKEDKRKKKVYSKFSTEVGTSIFYQNSLNPEFVSVIEEFLTVLKINKADFELDPQSQRLLILTDNSDMAKHNYNKSPNGKRRGAVPLTSFLTERCDLFQSTQRMHYLAQTLNQNFQHYSVLSVNQGRYIKTEGCKRIFGYSIQKANIRNYEGAY